MFSPIQIRRLSVGSVYKLIAIGIFSSLVPFSTVMGIFALFGASTVTWNGKYLTGMTGLFASPFVGIFLTLIFTGVFGTLFVFGLWVFSKFRPLTLMAKDVVMPANDSEKI